MSRRASEHIDLVLAGAAGGHLELLLAIAPYLDGLRRAWVTLPGTRADALATSDERVFTVPNANRRELSLRNPVAGVALATRLRPRVLLTSGAGNMVALAIAARGLGARLVFVETMARVTSSSTAGRVLAPFSDFVFVQWPELSPRYPRAIVCAPLLLEPPTVSPGPGKGTFVSVGTHSKPFDRLLRMVDSAVARGVLPEPVTVQAGPSRYKPRSFTSVAWMEPDEITRQVRDARYIIAHAGGGIVAAAIRAGRRPMLLARLASNGEHVDDHQRELAEKLSEVGAVVALADEITARDLRLADDRAWPQTWGGDSKHLGVEVRRAVDDLVGRRG